MKEKLLIIFVALFVFLSVSCEKQNVQSEPVQLAAPAITEVTGITETSFTISWAAVENATYYPYVLNEGADDQIKSFTSETQVTFTGLVPGTYEFKVKSAGDENLTIESEYSTYTVVLEEIPEFTFDVRNIEPKSATVAVLPAEEVGTYYYDITDPIYLEEMGEEAFLEYMVALLEEACVEYKVDLIELLSEGENSYGYSDLTPNTEYLVYAFGITEKGKVTTKLNTTTFTTTEYNLQPSDALKPFLGTWSASFEQSAQWGQSSDGYYYPQVTNVPWNTTITIEHHAGSGSEDVAVLYGWSALGQEYYAFGRIDEADRLVLYNEEVIGPENNGAAPTWMALANVINTDGTSSVSLAGRGQFPVYMLSAVNGTIEARRYVDEDENGVTYEMISYDIYAVGESSISIYHADPMSAGDVTFVATSPSATLTKMRSVEMLEKLNPLRSFEAFRIPSVSIYR